MHRRSGNVTSSGCPCDLWRSRTGSAPPCCGVRPGYSLPPEVIYDERRSAVHEPEQAPPVHMPPPSLPARRPMPVALLPPALTVTVMAPVSPTLPVMVNAESPALTSWPL